MAEHGDIGFSEEIFLLVDNSADDLVLTSRALAGVAGNELVALEGGQEAIKYLQLTTGTGDRRPLPIPALILIDLKMPALDGFELLSWIRRQPAFQDVIVVVLTGSTIEEDVLRAYELGTNLFLTKQHKLNDQRAQMEALVRFVRTHWEARARSV